MSIMSDLKKSFDADREALMKGMDAYREELREMDPEKLCGTALLTTGLYFASLASRGTPSFFE